MQGSSWWIISDELADYILKHKVVIEKMYSKMIFLQMNL